jgi:hypothetical protein
MFTMTAKVSFATIDFSQAPFHKGADPVVKLLKSLVSGGLSDHRFLDVVDIINGITSLVDWRKRLDYWAHLSLVEHLTPGSDDEHVHKTLLDFYTLVEAKAISGVDIHIGRGSQRLTGNDVLSKYRGDILERLTCSARYPFYARHAFGTNCQAKINGTPVGNAKADIDVAGWNPITSLGEGLACKCRPNFVEDRHLIDLSAIRNQFEAVFGTDCFYTYVVTFDSTSNMKHHLENLGRVNSKVLPEQFLCIGAEDILRLLREKPYADLPA